MTQGLGQTTGPLQSHSGISGVYGVQVDIPRLGGGPKEECLPRTVSSVVVMTVKFEPVHGGPSTRSDPYPVQVLGSTVGYPPAPDGPSA